MKLLCISAASEPSDEVKEPPTELREKPSGRLRVWYNSLRRGFKGRQKEPRVTISEPIEIQNLTQSELIQIHGVIEVKPEEDSDKAQVSRVNSVEGSTEANKETEKGATTAVTESSVDDQLSLNCESPSIDTATPGETSYANIALSTGDDEGEETAEQIATYVWFWGSITRREAENLLRGQKDGSFLVRESSDRRFLYSLSFRSNGKTMHTRIEYTKGLFFFYSNESGSHRGSDGSRTLRGLISVAMNQNNADSVFFYSRGLRSESTSLHTVSLNQPLSRYAYLLDYQYEANEKKALQYMCKFIAHHCPAARTKLDAQLPSLPVEMNQFAENGIYFPRPAAAAH